MINRQIKFIFVLTIYFFIASCGGGGSSTQGGIGGTGVSSGKVEGFGSVIVNGVHFDTTNAIVTKDDGTAVTNFNDADINQLLSKGMIINIEGTINSDGVTGTAEKITYQDDLEGPVMGTPAADASSFVALGQTVIVSSSLTQYSGGLNDISDIADGQVVEVSGFNDVNGNIFATYIERKATSYSASTIFEIKGIISSVVDASTFTIAGLKVVTSINTTGLNNEYVEVYGVFNGSDTLTANTVSIIVEGLSGSDKDDAELEGIAASGCTTISCVFKLSGTNVQINSNTAFEAGLAATDITTGVYLEAEGSFQSGMLIAEEIKFKDNIEIQADVQGKGSNTVVLDFGTNDLTLEVDTNTTRIINCGINGFADITIDENIIVRARKTASSVIATRIECGGSAGEVQLQAEVENVGTDTMTLLGLLVDTSGLNEEKFKDTNGNSIGSVNFYNALSNGLLVETVGLTNTTDPLVWLEVKLGQ